MPRSFSKSPGNPLAWVPTESALISAQKIAQVLVRDGAGFHKLNKQFPFAINHLKTV
jgi:hypothetical protein